MFNQYIKEIEKRYRKSFLVSGMVGFFAFYLLLSFFETDEVTKAFISGLILPIMLSIMKDIIKEFGERRNTELLTKEAKLYFEEGIISADEYDGIKQEIRKVLEQRGYIDKIENCFLKILK